MFFLKKPDSVLLLSKDKITHDTVRKFLEVNFVLDNTLFDFSKKYGITYFSSTVTDITDPDNLHFESVDLIEFLITPDVIYGDFYSAEIKDRFLIKKELENLIEIDKEELESRIFLDPYFLDNK